MGSKQDEKNSKILRGLITDVPANRRCADCTAKGPVYVNTTFNTFICTTCSGLHREFNHRVKSISMATFKPDEMTGLSNGGNEVARQIYLAKWTPSEFPEPDPGDPERIRQYIRLKYIDKRWAIGGANAAPAASSAKKTASPTGSSAWQPFADKSVPKAEPLEKILGSNIPPIQVNQSSHLHPAPAFHSSASPVTTAPAQSSDWATAWSNSTPQPAAPIQPIQPIQPAQSGQTQPNLFPSSPPPSHAPTLTPNNDAAQKFAQESQVSNKTNSLQSQLGQLYQQSAQQQAQQQMMMQQQLMQQQQQMFMQQQQQLQQLNAMFQQMAAANGGQLNQQQMQQFMMMKQQIMMGAQQQGMQGQQFPGQQQQFPGQQQQFPGQQGFPGGPTSGMPGVVAPVVDSSWVVEEQKPVEPAKPDPFASLSPFSLGGAPVVKSGGPVRSNPPVISTPQPVVHDNNPFGGGGDLMGFGGASTSSTTSHMPTSDPGNPFF